MLEDWNFQVKMLVVLPQLLMKVPFRSLHRACLTVKPPRPKIISGLNIVSRSTSLTQIQNKQAGIEITIQR